MNHTDEKEKRMTTRFAVLLAVVAGLAVGNLYWAQPLLADIAADFGVSADRGGLLVTAPQLGYALGILFIVPLGDIMSKRTILLGVTTLAIVFLALCAAAPSLWHLGAALIGMGICTVSGQIIVPLAGDLAEANTRGRIVGIVASGITIGILCSRLLSGVVADIWGWRSVYVVAVACNLAGLGMIWLRVPHGTARASISYGRLIQSVMTALRRHPAVAAILIKQGLIFGICFNLFWTAMTFVLAEVFQYTPLQIGLFSMAGLAGAAAGARFGGLQDGGYGDAAMGVFIALTAVCMTAAAFCGQTVAGLAGIAVVFSIAVQGVGVLCQARLFMLSDTERSRLNTVYVVSNFMFSALGSFLAAYAWREGGWELVAALAAGAAVLALASWAYDMVKRKERI